MPYDSYEHVDKFSEYLGNLSAFFSDIEGKFVMLVILIVTLGSHLHVVTHCWLLYWW